MADKIKLSHWEGIELFCKILCKYETVRRLSDFKDNTFLVNKLKNYSKEAQYLKVSMQVFNGDKDKDIIQDKNRKESARKIKSFYHNLVYPISRGLPVSLLPEDFKSYCDYIGDKKLEKKKAVEEFWVPNDKQRLLEGSSWILYFYNDEHTADDDKPIIKGITASILKLKDFAKAEIKGYKDDECYVGEYLLKGENSDFLSLSMRLKMDKSEDLSVLAFIGPSRPSLALGIYQNRTTHITYGTLLLDTVVNQPDNLLTPKFYNQESLKTLPLYVRKYFDKQRRHDFKVPENIRSISDFYKWYRVEFPDEPLHE